MRIEILRQTSIQGQPVWPGDVIDAADPDARYLLARGKAQAVQDLIPQPLATRPRTRKPRIPEAA